MQGQISPTRRTRAKGKQGIYYREVKDGNRSRRRYEVTYLDSDGRRRWQTIPGHDNLEQAEAALVAIKGKLHNGVRTFPAGHSDSWNSGTDHQRRRLAIH